MHAAWMERTGPAAEVFTIGELADPIPGPGEVLVRVRASGVNPSDVKHRAGWRQATLRFPRVVPHSDGAGEIVALGQGVPSSRLHERVWLWGSASPFETMRPLGTAAELVALPSAQAVPLPEAMGFDEGACLGIPACTAHRAIHADGPVAGQTILVQGGAGAVGHYAVQMAVAAGAKVIATVDGPAKEKHARQAGAHETIDRQRENVADRVMALTRNAGVDRIVEVDFAANAAITAVVLKQNGVIASYSSPSSSHPVLDYYALQFRGATLRLLQVYTMEQSARAAAREGIDRLSAAGRLAHAIDSRYPLEAIAQAHARIESGQTIGNVVVLLD